MERKRHSDIHCAQQPKISPCRPLTSVACPARLHRPQSVCVDLHSRAPRRLRIGRLWATAKFLQKQSSVRPERSGPETDFHQVQLQSLPGNSPNESRLSWIVGEGRTDLSDCRVDAMLHINENFTAPKAIRDLLTCNDAFSTADQQDEQFQRLAFQPDDLVPSAQFETVAINREFVKFVNGTTHVSAPTRAV
jgi:hypothetical protein